MATPKLPGSLVVNVGVSLPTRHGGIGFTTPTPAIPTATQAHMPGELSPGTRLVLTPERLPDRGYIAQLPVLILSSGPYPVAPLPEAMDVQASFLGASIFNVLYEDSVDLTASLVSGSLLTILKTYNDWPDESMNLTPSLVSGDLLTILKTYNDWPDESMDLTAPLVSGVLTTVLITYNDWPTESMDLTAALTSGVLA